MITKYCHLFYGSQCIVLFLPYPVVFCPDSTSIVQVAFVNTLINELCMYTMCGSHIKKAKTKAKTTNIKPTSTRIKS